MQEIYRLFCGFLSLLLASLAWWTVYDATESALAASIMGPLAGFYTFVTLYDGS